MWKRMPGTGQDLLQLQAVGIDPLGTAGEIAAVNRGVIASEPSSGKQGSLLREAYLGSRHEAHIEWELPRTILCGA
jgi:hypothetical protein